MSLLNITRILEARGEFYQRVLGAVLTKAVEVYGESSATPNHAERLVWAKDVIAEGNYRRRAEEIYRLALTIPSVIADADALTDEAILAGVESFIPQVIGV